MKKSVIFQQFQKFPLIYKAIFIWQREDEIIKETEKQNKQKRKKPWEFDAKTQSGLVNFHFQHLWLSCADEWKWSWDQGSSRKTKIGGSTGFSRAVPHLSTDPALSYLTSEFGWDPVHLA